MHNTNRFRLGLTTLSFASLGFLATQAMAAPFGTLNVANCSGQGVTVTTTTVVFAGNCIQTGSGTNVVTSFGNLLPSVTGTIANLPVTPPTNPFMSFLVGGNNLNFVLVGTGPGVNNTVCVNTFNPNDPACSVFAGSPFILQPGAGGTTVLFAAHGTVSDAAGSTTWNGVFSANFANSTPLALRNAFVANGTLQATTFSGSFAVSTPEPTSLISLGMGLVLLGGGVLRRRRRV